MIVGAARKALNEGEPCGDAFLWWSRGPLWTICLVDGLGHGVNAARASEMALSQASASREASPRELLKSIDGAIRNSRGAAMTIIEVDTAKGTLVHAGIGNVRAAIVGDPVTRFEARPGIVGTGVSAMSAETATWRDGDLLVLWTDGIPAYLELGPEHRGLGGDPERLAESLIKTVATGRDDAAIVCCHLRRQDP